MSVRFNDNIKVSAPKPLDDRYFQNINGLTPWNSINEVNASIPIHHRYTGLTVNILSEEYWYKDDVLDDNLVLKSFGGGTGDTGFKENFDLTNWIVGTGIHYIDFIHDKNQIPVHVTIAELIDGVYEKVECAYDFINSNTVRIYVQELSQRFVGGIIISSATVSHTIDGEQITAETINSALGYIPADNAAFTGHIENNTIHVTSGDTTYWNNKADKSIEFGRTITGDTTIETTDLYKLVYINSATDVEVTIDNMVVGSGVRFHVLGAGLPVFLEGVNQSITGIDEDGKPLGTDRKDVLIERFEDISGTEIYNVI